MAFFYSITIFVNSLLKVTQYYLNNGPELLYSLPPRRGVCAPSVAPLHPKTISFNHCPEWYYIEVRYGIRRDFRDVTVV